MFHFYIALKSRLLNVIGLQLELKMSKPSTWEMFGNVFFFWHTGMHGLPKMRCKNATRILAFLNRDIDFANQKPALAAIANARPRISTSFRL